ncbi:alpha-amylase family protein [Oceaniglobus roseus]|uniref:alpha-amylase family protein n=1 Tax=Oceaniglobus roseus TaxID=1737570 RepID=UPI000C7F2F5C|nr:alpha-amylase family protein [Kandeliimicrobium roseum]
MPTKDKTPTIASVDDDTLFRWRWDRGAMDLMTPLNRLYGEATDIDALGQRLKTLLKEKWDARPADLRAQDLARDINPGWFLSQQMVGYVFYIDRFSGTLKALPEKIPYLQELGVTYAHFMPCLKPRPGDSDGGYAVMDYGAINPALGTMADFRKATAKLRAAGISTCVDMVLNHTAKEHVWAQRARAGDAFYQSFYRMFDTDILPRQYEHTLLEVFPNQAPGNFTWYPDIQKWVWTTFNEYQWDLNWENPEVFLAVLGIILDLANNGADVMRLDAVAFMWKRMGTICQNLPEVHDLLQAIVQATRIAAPGVIHKAEAIVGPTDLVPYLGQGRHAGRESNLAYHNNLMVQFWSTLASRDARMMADVLAHHFPKSFRNAQWATYIRCHDDIGWAITEADAERHPPLTGPGHRKFLTDFFTARHPGSFARGADFQVNEVTGDRRTNGTFASLAGLETALESGDAHMIRLAVDRILMGHALIASFGGMPLLYMGDEIGMLNDHSYLDDPDLAGDGRWMQRPRMDWATAGEAATADTPQAWIWRGVRHIMARRKVTPQLAGTVPTEIIPLANPALFALRRPGDEAPLTAVFNFSEHWQNVAGVKLGLNPAERQFDALAGQEALPGSGTLSLPPYGRVWLVPQS